MADREITFDWRDGAVLGAIAIADKPHFAAQAFFRQECFFVFTECLLRLRGNQVIQ